MKSREQIRKQIKRLMDSSIFNYAVTIIGLALLIFAYAFTQSEAKTNDGRHTPSETELNFAVVAEGIEAYSYPDRQGLVISTQVEWAALWYKLQLFTIPRPALPAIDFSKQVVLGVLVGEKEGSGYMVHVRKVIIRPEQELVVYAVEQRARPNEQTNNDSPPAYPFQIITIPRLDLPVRFEFQ